MICGVRCSFCLGKFHVSADRGNKYTLKVVDQKIYLDVPKYLHLHGV